MNRYSVDPEEMARREDVDLDAILNMIGEGSPIFESYPYDDDVFERMQNHQAKEDLPETYQ